MSRRGVQTYRGVNRPERDCTNRPVVASQKCDLRHALRNPPEPGDGSPDRERVGTVCEDEGDRTASLSKSVDEDLVPLGQPTYIDGQEDPGA
jgi:hypothetical protein